uniref:Uncharacterized protein n=1 Tax=Malurus cyaneus samueli TaxID=2593467 RepID=A0A8C5T9I7_9PASS
MLCKSTAWNSLLFAAQLPKISVLTMGFLHVRMSAALPSPPLVHQELYFVLLCVSKKPMREDNGSTPDIILRKDNPFMTLYQGKDSGSEDEAASRVPDLEKDDFAARRARMNQPKHVVPFNSFLFGPYTSKEKGKLEDVKKPLQMEKKEHARCAFIVLFFQLVGSKNPYRLK